MNTKLNKIFIVGIYGTGKSTLANQIGKILNLPVHGADEIKYKRKYDIEYTLKERLGKINKIAKQKKWIVEGPLTSYALPWYKKADLVILLLPNKWVAIKRIISRYFTERKKQKLVNDNLKTTLKIIKHVLDYYNNKEVFLTQKKHLWYVKNYSKNHMIINNNSQIKELLEIINKRYK